MMVLGGTGAAVFLLLLALSFATPTFVEQTAKEIIRYRIEAVTQEKIDSLDNHAALVARAQRLMGRQGRELALLKQQLAANLLEKIVETMARMRDMDCECRRITQENIENTMKWRIASLSDMQQQLISFIEVKYMQITAQLTREFRIFTDTNGVVFLILFLAAFIQKQSGIQLLLPAVLITVSTFIEAYAYLFGQNWLQTILFSSYVGWFYLGYIGIVFVLLCDILFFKGIIIRTIIEAIGTIISSLTPC